MKTTMIFKRISRLHLFILFHTPFFAYSNLLNFNLTIIHLNNFEARFLPTDIDGTLCKDDDGGKPVCFGGYARLKQKISEIQDAFPDAILLNSGDFVQGTILSTVYGWNISSHFLNKLPHTAFTIGYQELEVGITEDLPAFFDSLHTPVVSCNMNDSDTDSGQNAIHDKLKKSIVVEVNGTYIGITGYITTAAKMIPSLYEMEFLDEKESVLKEAERLRNQHNVKAVLVLSQGGYEMDLEIAKLPGVDVVIGGRSATFLYSGAQPPSNEIPSGPYPTVIIKENGTPGLVVQAYRFGKYIGFLQIQFVEGRPVSWFGNPILLDESVPLDPTAAQEIASWSDNLAPLRQTTVGYTHVYLDGSFETCGKEECNMGSLISDSMVYGSLKYAIDFQWNYAAIAVHDAGGIRSSIRNGSISLDDLYAVLPFRNSIDLVEIKGEHIYEVFEFSAMKLHENPKKAFQVSGIQVTLDICEPPGQRVRQLLVSCNECRSPKYELLEKNIYYRLILPGYLSTGGGGYKIFTTSSISHQRTELIDIDMLKEYLQKHGPVTTGLEGRIVILGDPTCYKGSQGFRASFSNSLYILLAFGFTIIN